MNFDYKILEDNTIEVTLVHLNLGDKIIIPEKVINRKVTSIGEKAFYLSKFYEVFLPNTITKIKDEAFLNCWNLSEINIPENLEYLGKGAFRETDISYIKLPQGITEINEDTFRMCRSLNSIILSNNIKKISSGAFWGTDNLTHIKLPEGLNYIGENAFRSSGISEMEIPDSVEYIGKGAFYDTYDLKKIKLSESIIEINESLFNYSHINKIKIPESVNEIKDKAFFRCDNLREIEISKNVKNIGSLAFNNKKIIIDNENPYIKVENNILFNKNKDKILKVFNCDLKEYNIPGKVKFIEEKAFLGIKKLNSIKIGKNIEHIGKDAFLDCGNLREVIFETENEELKLYMFGYNEILSLIDIIKKFDFKKYDEFFDNIKLLNHKYLIAINRIKYPIKVATDRFEMYKEYLKNNVFKIMEKLIKLNNIPDMKVLADIGCFTNENIEKLIEIGNELKSVDTVSYLLNYKNDNLNRDENEFIL